MKRSVIFRSLPVRFPVFAALLLATGCLLNRPAAPVAPVESTPASPINPAAGVTGTGGLTAQSPEEQAYLDAIRRQSDPVKASVGRFNEAMRTPRPTNDTWKRDLNTEIDRWPTFATQLNPLTPPARFQRFHAAYREALLHMGVAAALMAEVQRTGNSALVSEINARITEANQQYAEASRRAEIVNVDRISAVLPTSLVAR